MRPRGRPINFGVFATSRAAARGASAPASRMASRPFLPAPLTRLLGREQETASLCATLGGGEVRIVTLTGPPGVGKTRLAIEVATRLAPRFTDGAVFVRLAPVGSPDLVLPAIAEALGVREEAHEPLEKQLERVLRGNRQLIVLDNFEHVEAAAPLVAGLLQAAPELRLLATSRVPLRISGEHLFRVLPFAVPDLDRPPPLPELARNPAVALFVERARCVSADFTLRGENALAVARVCQRLDGIPLAIELAAARARLLGPQALLDRLSDRLALLRGGARDLPPRLQTLEAAIAWSYDLLGPGERRLLCRLAAFPGSWDLEAAEAVAGGGGDIVEPLHALVDHSLVRTAAGGDASPRFSLLEMIREFAWTHLARDGGVSATELRSAHARYFASLAERLGPRLRTAEQPQVLARLDAEHDNLRAALAWLTSQADAEGALRLTADLWEFWQVRGHLSEGRRWLARALALSGGSPAARARALTGAGVLARVHGEWEAARAHLRAACDAGRDAGDEAIRAEALTNLAIVAMTLGELHEAGRLNDEAAELWKRSETPWGTAFSLNVRAGVIGLLGDLAGSCASHLDALAISRATGDPQLISRNLLGLGEAFRHSADHEAASQWYAAALDHFRAAGNDFHAALVLRRFAQVEIHRGRLDHAASLLRESYRLFRSLEHESGVAGCANTLACLYHARGERELAARCFGATEAALAGRRGVVEPADLGDRDAAIAASRRELGSDAFAELAAAGRGTDAIALLDEFCRAGPVPAEEPGAGAAAAEAAGPREPLTRRELAVLRLLARGHSYAEIGKRLFISPRTVDAHLRSIYGKLRVRSRHEAASYALENGLV